MAQTRASWNTSVKHVLRKAAKVCAVTWRSVLSRDVFMCCHVTYSSMEHDSCFIYICMCDTHDISCRIHQDLFMYATWIFMYEMCMKCVLINSHFDPTCVCVCIKTYWLLMYVWHEMCRETFVAQNSQGVCCHMTHLFMGQNVSLFVNINMCDMTHLYVRREISREALATYFTSHMTHLYVRREISQNIHTDLQQIYGVGCTK